MGPSIGMTLGVATGNLPGSGMQRSRAAAHRHSVCHSLAHFRARGDSSPKPSRIPGQLQYPSSADGMASNEDVQDLGVLHKARLVKGGQANKEGDDQSVTIISAAVEDYMLQEKAALDGMAPYIARLQPGALLVEVGSRCGEFAAMVAERFPEHQVQPTEGTGQTAPGLFLLLQERVVAHNRVRQERSLDCTGGRLMAPRYVDAGCLDSWKTDLGRTNVGCIFAANVLHYLPDETMKVLLLGCRQVLRPGGFVLLSGPFFNEGEVTESNLKSHGALQDFAEHSTEDFVREPLRLGLHDLQRLREHAEATGLEFVEQRNVGLDWHLLVLRQPFRSQGAPTLGRRGPKHVHRGTYSALKKRTFGT